MQKTIKPKSDRGSINVNPQSIQSRITSSQTSRVVVTPSVAGYSVLAFQSSPNTSNSNAILSDDQLHSLWTKVGEHYDWQERKEFLYVTAIKNLLKKTSFLELMQQLSDNLISEEEFESEIEKNPETYVITTDDVKCQEDLEAISSILKKIGKDFSVDDVAEIFSLDLASLNDNLNLLSNNNEICTQ